jgi:predicted secreted protein
MNFISIAIVFILSWWMIFFMVLPWGIEMEGPNSEGNLPGAPKKHNLKKKFIITTCIAFLFTAIISTLIVYNVVDFRGLATEMFNDDFQ